MPPSLASVSAHHLFLKISKDKEGISPTSWSNQGGWPVRLAGGLARSGPDGLCSGGRGGKEVGWTACVWGGPGRAGKNLLDLPCPLLGFHSGHPELWYFKK